MRESGKWQNFVLFIRGRSEIFESFFHGFGVTHETIEELLSYPVRARLQMRREPRNPFFRPVFHEVTGQTGAKRRSTQVRQWGSRL